MVLALISVPLPPHAGTQMPLPVTALHCPAPGAAGAHGRMHGMAGDIAGGVLQLPARAAATSGRAMSGIAGVALAIIGLSAGERIRYRQIPVTRQLYNTGLPATMPLPPLPSHGSILHRL